MSDVIQYLINNYIWILSIIIIILLAIIGYFADKIKLGQTTTEKTTTKEKLKNERMSDLLTTESKEEKVEDALEEFQQVNEEISDPTIEKLETNNTVEIIDSKDDEVIEEKAETLNEKKSEEIDIDEVFNEVIPVKSLMDTDFITDIENLTIDSKRNKTTEIPDLDDIELPKIESLSSEQEDIWRF